MSDLDQDARVAVMAPMVRMACVSLVQAIRDVGEEDARASLALMRADPTETIMWEAIEGSRAWDRYEAGGPLEAQHVELLIGPDVHLTPAEAEALLRSLAAPDSRVEGTNRPWRFTLSSPGAPSATATIRPYNHPHAPEDLLVQVHVGCDSLLAGGLVSDELIRSMWKETTTAALVNWHRVNSQRAIADHPGFAQVVERPALGSPGVYLIRVPRFPFSPLMPADIYQRPVAWTVFETAAEFEECERYYQTPGASVSARPPVFRNRPPCSDRPARLAGGISEAGHRVVGTPWSDVGVVSVVTFPTALLERLTHEDRTALHRGRYGVYTASSVDDAKRQVREMYGPGLDPKTVRSPRSLHPKATVAVALRSPKLVVVSEPGIEQEAHALYWMHQSLEKRPVPAGSLAVAVIGENADLAEALTPYVVVAAASAAGDGGSALTEALSSEARAVVIDPDALGFAVMALPEHVDRGPHGVTVIVIATAVGDGIITDLARKLDAKVILLEASATLPGHGRSQLAGRIERAGLPCLRMPATPVPPVSLGEIAHELWTAKGGSRHG